MSFRVMPHLALFLMSVMAGSHKSLPNKKGHTAPVTGCMTFSFIIKSTGRRTWWESNPQEEQQFLSKLSTALTVELQVLTTNISMLFFSMHTKTKNLLNVGVYFRSNHRSVKSPVNLTINKKGNAKGSSHCPRFKF
jgi:hypothetical protein